MIFLPQDVKNCIHSTVVKTDQKIMRYGIEMEKGAVTSKQRIEKNRELYEKYFEFWINYPDCFLDFIKPVNSHFHLFFYQRLFLRLVMRFPRLFTIAPRAFSKSFLTIFGLYLMAMFKPGGKYFIVAPGKA